ncbi:MAG TPA: hypothetical protein VFU10_00005, partial [Gaiellaceae bacterium]|nr:hypothetical protein [Gaiellaceae bacterium]
VDDLRQGGDPRLPLELALVKVTRPSADLERESLAYRIEQLEQRGHVPAPAEAPAAAPEPEPPASDGPPLELEQLQEAWTRSVLPHVEQRSIPTASIYREARPVALADDAVTVEFPGAAAFHRQLAEEQKNVTLLVEALYEVTGRRLLVAFTVGEDPAEEADVDEPAGEERILELMKQTFDAREVDE